MANFLEDIENVFRELRGNIQSDLVPPLTAYSKEQVKTIIEIAQSLLKESELAEKRQEKDSQT